MTQINVYLSFNGNCREAMNFYKDCFGGELTIHTFEGSPMAAQMPEAAQQAVMHASLRKDHLLLLASDGGGMYQGYTKGNTISISLNCSSDEEITDFFNKLSVGGTVTMPLADQFWGAKFGMLTDKYNMDWMLNYDKTPQQ